MKLRDLAALRKEVEDYASKVVGCVVQDCKIEEGRCPTLTGTAFSYIFTLEHPSGRKARLEVFVPAKDGEIGAVYIDDEDEFYL